MPGGYEYHDIYYISMFVAESNKYPKILIFLHMAPDRGRQKNNNTKQTWEKTQDGTG